MKLLVAILSPEGVNLLEDEDKREKAEMKGRETQKSDDSN